ncbi:MAG: AtpZ/AtpI family protein [Spirochaetales bacterium]
MSDERDRRFAEKLKRDESRRMKAVRKREHGDRWAGLGMIGLVGWAFAIPMLAVLSVGIWLDTQTDSPFAWSLMAVFVGAFIGGLNAWYWVRHEEHNTNEEHERE